MLIQQILDGRAAIKGETLLLEDRAGGGRKQGGKTGNGTCAAEGEEWDI